MAWVAAESQHQLSLEATPVGIVGGRSVACQLSSRRNLLKLHTKLLLLRTWIIMSGGDQDENPPELRRFMNISLNRGRVHDRGDRGDPEDLRRLLNYRRGTSGSQPRSGSPRTGLNQPRTPSPRGRGRSLQPASPRGSRPGWDCRAPSTRMNFVRGPPTAGKFFL